MMGVDTLISLIFDSLQFYEKLVFVIIFLIISFSSFVFFQSNQFLKKLRFYYFSYWAGIIIFIAAIIFKILAINFIIFSNTLIYTCFYSFYFLSFVISTLFPLLKYHGGLQIFIESKIIVPLTGEKIEIRFINKTPLDEEITISLNLPENVIGKDKLKNMNKIFRLRGNSRISISKKILPLKNDLEKIAFLNVTSQIFGDIRKKILFRT
jgi:hypothetical protein